jgi:hypothetical protein
LAHAATAMKAPPNARIALGTMKRASSTRALLVLGVLGRLGLLAFL